MIIEEKILLREEDFFPRSTRRALGHSETVGLEKSYARSRSVIGSVLYKP